MKAPYIDIRIAATCAKCDYAEWKHYLLGDRWYCALFVADIRDIGGYPITELGKKGECEQVDACKALVRRYEELPEVDPCQ